LHVKHVASRYYSSRNSTASSISLSNAGDIQRESINNTQCPRKRPILRVMCLHLWRPSHLRLCADNYHNIISIWLDILSTYHSRFSTRSLRFMDAYQKGLNGKQASWAVKKYHGHHGRPYRCQSHWNFYSNT
jgi:hypothetical protein